MPANRLGGSLAVRCGSTARTLQIRPETLGDAQCNAAMGTGLHGPARLSQTVHITTLCAGGGGFDTVVSDSAEVVTETQVGD